MIEGLNIHFVHEKSLSKDAIPLLLLHGWPGQSLRLCSLLSFDSLVEGSFTEFIPVITPLTQNSITLTGKSVSYHVVVASLPGFTFSSAPPANWTVDDTGRIFNTLMTEVLGYSTFTVHGTDWVDF